MSINANTGSSLVETFVKPIAVGAIAALGTSMMYDLNTFKIKLLDMKIPFWAASAVGAGAASLAADIVHQYILPEIAPNAKLSYSGSMLLAPVITAAGVPLAFQLMHPNAVGQLGFVKLAAIGAASEIAGMYAFEAVIAPYLNRQDV